MIMPENLCEEALQDIEDLFISNHTDINENKKSGKVVPRVKRINNIQEEPPSAVLEDNYIPGTGKVYIKTWGCTHNSSDSEYMAGLLAEYGFKIVDDSLSADLWLLNSCTVKNPAEDHFRNEVSRAEDMNKKVVVCGCVPQGEPKSSYLKGLSVVGVQQIDRVVEVVEETLKGNSVRLLGSKKTAGRKAGGAALSLPKIRRNPLIEIIPISTGCLNHCTYCKTKHARGQLGSYPTEDIVARAREAFNDGVVEIWLTSEDTGAYGRDIGTALPELLYELIKVIPEHGRLRLGMTNPPYILDHIQEMADILSHPRVYSFLHIPVQSGSDCVLKEMKREYDIKEFKTIVDYLRERVANITIATDIICGFPTETEEDFDLTMKLCEEYKFPSLFINQFFPRPGTPAAKMLRIPTKQVKARSRRLTDLFQSYETYSDRIGQIQQVLVTEVAHDKVHYVGHNKSYEQVLVPKDDRLMGKMIKVRIVSAGKHYLVGAPCDTKSPIREGIIFAVFLVALVLFSDLLQTVFL